ncbi:polysaccharide pyruvyl transferase family protein [Oribacterium sp. P6A1]|uniref:polysaccharide pyruvyl transferase family protein n=1 Tax=Oribacterium sp. P6A1 TaxID=1410612 RepID=UPI0006901551|nr:polysaccharide pyruvyl transferase family protein [Oribacterium sp. P6A1]
MNICILGWYGTETLGDRAILDGIIKIFEEKNENNKYFLGSLFPFFSQRTLYLDADNYSFGKKLNIEIFCEKDINILKDRIRCSDYVIMGGGPIMDIPEILIIRKAFKLAKKNKITTGLIGCGFGPFHDEYYESIAKDILNYSDVTIFRDEISSQRAYMCNNGIKAVTLSDPAVISALVYRENTMVNKADYIAINYRDTRFKVYQDSIVDLMSELYEFTANIANSFSEVKLVPMHSFFWGGDDRGYFAEMMLDRNIGNVNIVFEPQSLYELYDCYSAAVGCVGMRYHSIILQTILNGNNIILDYTEGKTGKISGFMKELDGNFYSNRYVNIYDTNWVERLSPVDVLSSNMIYEYSKKSHELILNYVREIF